MGEFQPLSNYVLGKCAMILIRGEESMTMILVTVVISPINSK